MYHRFQSSLFELPLKYRFKKRAFRIEKMERCLGKVEAQVYVIGTCEPHFPSSASYSTSTMLHEHHLRYQSPLFELPYNRACRRATTLSYPSNTSDWFKSGPCVWPVIAARIGINNALPLQPVDF